MCPPPPLPPQSQDNNIDPHRTALPEHKHYFIRCKLTDSSVRSLGCGKPMHALSWVSGCQPCPGTISSRARCHRQQAWECPWMLTSWVERARHLPPCHIRLGNKLNTAQIFTFGDLTDLWEKENKSVHVFTHNDSQQSHPNTSLAFH